MEKSQVVQQGSSMTLQQGQHRIELDLSFGQKSDCGPARSLNEDYADCFVPAPSDEAQRRAKGAIFLMADGMGGHQAGEVASRQAVERVMQEYYADSTHKPGDSLVRAFKVANQMLYDYASSDPTKAGMGTTLVAAIVLGRKVYVANVGDSRAYLIDKTGLTQITEDHSWVEEQVQAGFLTREQAERHPQRNLITRALGAKPSVEVDLFEGELSEGDMLLLCTDGLCGPLSKQQMAHIVRSQQPPQAAVQLVALASAQGGEDNASAIVVKVAAPQPTVPAAIRRDTDRPRTAAQADRASWAVLGVVKDWLEGPGVLRIGEGRQRLVVGLAALAFVCCLCVAIVILPAMGQRLAGNPLAAPQLAPIRDERLNGKGAEQVGAYLGYSNQEEMIAAHPGQFNAEELDWGDLWPAQRGVFLVGRVRNWECLEQACSFQLRMVDKDYTVSYNQQPSGDNEVNLRGRQVRVFGYQSQEGATVTAQFIERGSQWWAWWQRAWTIVYEVHRWDRVVWAYGTVDRSPNGLLDTDEAPALQRKDQVLLQGTWQVGKRSTIFSRVQIYRLQGDKYVPLAQESIPLPEPTVTLMPTRSMSNNQ